MKKYLLTMVVMTIFAIGFAASDEEASSSSKQQTEQKETQEEVQHDFFENGYVYSTSYNVIRQQGYGISCSYKYKIRIYNDGTKEMMQTINPEGSTNSPSAWHDCKISKKSGSNRDFSATWYEIEWGGERLLVDEKGNIYELYVNGANKDIYEAIATNDCIFGKFTKEKLTKTQNRICKTCGEEFNPDKELIVNDDYCYQDYPQICDYCGKSYTVRSEGGDAGKGICSRCRSKKTAGSIYKSVTGRDFY